MSDTSITLRGRVGTDLEAHRTKNGQTTVKFRLAVTNWFASAEGILTQGRTHWYTIRAWDRLAENVFRSLKKGQPVIVVGRPKADAWISKEDGRLRSEVAITAQTIGHDLVGGCAGYEKTEKLWTMAAPAPLAPSDEGVGGLGDEAGEGSGLEEASAPADSEARGGVFGDEDGNAPSRGALSPTDGSEGAESPVTGGGGGLAEDAPRRTALAYA